MTAYSAPAPHRSPLPTREPDRRKVVPHLTNRFGALLATAGLALALVSLYLPWLDTGTGTLSALGITEVIDVRSVAPVLFLGLLAILLLIVITLVTRYGAVAVAATVVAAAVLLAHVAFLWALYTSVGSGDATLAGLPAAASVTWGPYVAAVGLLLATAGSAWAARSARHVGPDF